MLHFFKVSFSLTRFLSLNIYTFYIYVCVYMYVNIYILITDVYLVPPDQINAVEKPFGKAPESIEQK